jgi:hypothetical protein
MHTIDCLVQEAPAIYWCHSALVPLLYDSRSSNEFRLALGDLLLA